MEKGPLDTYIGIDFSGNHLMWRPGRNHSNVWIARLVERSEELELVDLRRVQQIPGDDPPFLRLTNLLREGDYRAAAMDAPFSVPQGFLPGGTHQGLLDLVGELECEGDRPFPTAAKFVSAVAGQEVCDPPQPLRRTEQLWQQLGVNVRSTLWCKPRGGAPMTAAALKLLGEARRPLWPWCKPGEHGLLVEAFPAAQLRQWEQFHDRYNGLDNLQRREQIVGYLEAAHPGRPRVVLAEHRNQMEQNADALDAVLAAFAARAVAQGHLARPLPQDALVDEGWIAVHA
jgi:hypothetical protein